MHTMNLISKLIFWEVWQCPTCGREIRITWYPKWKREIVVPGDETVSHSGFRSAENMQEEK